MKKTLIIVIALILCMSLSFVSCELSSQIDSGASESNDRDDKKENSDKDNNKGDTEGNNTPVKPPKGNPTTISQNLCVSSTDANTPYLGLLSYNGDLTIEEGVQITSSGISHLAIVVNGTLTIKKGATIRVRNGYYADAPSKSITSLTADSILSEPKTDNGILLFEGYYGRGGDGGSGGDGIAGSYHSGYSVSAMAGGHSGYGGAGGFGGGVFGANGNCGGGTIPGKTYTGQNAAADGGATGVGSDGNSNKQFAGEAGGGNGGNAGGSGQSRSQRRSGFGGGGGGYGGGVLSIYADKIVVEDTSAPVFVALGQFGGKCGYVSGINYDTVSDDFLRNYTNHYTLNNAKDGHNGDGGLLYICADEYESNPQHWTSSYGTATANPLQRGKTEGQFTVYEGGHSSMVHTIPGAVFVNGEKLAGSDASGNSPNNPQPNNPSPSNPIPDTPSSTKCYQCNGSGKTECFACDGTGQALQYYIDHNPVYGSCLGCRGTGKLTCGSCGGDGMYP